MAKIIDSDIVSRKVSDSYSWQHNFLLGSILGLLFWAITMAIRSVSNSDTVPGDIATILVATTGILIMVKTLMARPLVVALAVAVCLWGLAGLTAGLVWYEVVFWDMLLYGLSYLLFSWLCRYSDIIPIMVATIIIAALTRITMTL